MAASSSFAASIQTVQERLAVLFSTKEVLAAHPAGNRPRLCFLSSGIPLPNDFFNDWSRNIPSLAQFSGIVNQIPRICPDGTILYNGVGNLVDFYAELMTPGMVEHAVLAPVSSTEEENRKRLLGKLTKTTVIKDIITDEEKTVVVPSDLVTEYERYKKFYFDKVDEYNEVFLRTTVGSEEERKEAQIALAVKGGALRRQRSDAYGQWESLGHKNDWERIQAALEAMSKRSPELAWSSYRDIFRHSQLDGGVYGLLYPSYPTPESFVDQKWTAFSWKSDTNAESTVKQDSDVHVGAGIKSQIATMSIDAHVKDTEAAATSQLNFCELTMEATRVAIVRPWFNEQIFYSPKWKYAQGDHVICDGNPVPSGSLPAYLAEMIVVRNLRMTSNASADEVSEAIKNKNVDGTLKAGWGPFSIEAGNCKVLREQKRTSKLSTRESTVVEAPSMQIIGFVVNFLPKCPNPDF